MELSLHRLTKVGQVALELYPVGHLGTALQYLSNTQVLLIMLVLVINTTYASLRTTIVCTCRTLIAPCNIKNLNVCPNEMRYRHSQLDCYYLIFYGDVSVPLDGLSITGTEETSTANHVSLALCIHQELLLVYNRHVCPMICFVHLLFLATARYLVCFARY